MRRLLLLKSFVPALVFVLLAGCGAPNLGADSSAKTPIWKIFPTEITSEEVENGWTNYTVKIVLENQGASEFLPAYILTGAKVETKEGFTYDVQPPNIGQDHWIPQGFRVSGYSEGPFTISFRAASTSTPLRIRLARNETFDLAQTSVSNFPTSRPTTDFRSLAEVLTLSDEQLEFTLDSPRKNTERVENALGGTDRTIAVNVKVQNLNQGQESQGSGLIERCFIIDGRGRILDQMKGVGPSGYGLGPGQSLEGIMAFPLYFPGFGGQKPTDAEFDASFTNSKLLCPTGYPNDEKMPKEGYIYNLN